MRSSRPYRRALRPPAGAFAGVTLTILATLAAPPLAAHEFWIEPAAWTAAPGAVLALRLRVGEPFAGEPLPRDPAHLARFTAVGGEGERPIPGAAGVDPAGMLAAGPGAYVVVYGSHPGALRMDAARFDAYLAEEGLESIRRERERRGEQDLPVRERFSRCAKALIRVGEVAAEGALFLRPVGLALELVPEADPTRAPAGSELPVRLLHEGEPVAGALVAAVPAGRPAARVTARTDATGRVVLPLGEPGAWLISAVHMLRAPAGSGTDWESLWASLTFETRGGE